MMRYAGYVICALAILMADAVCGEFKTQAGGKWGKLTVDQNVVPGSIMDFSSFLNDAPAGKHGHLVVGKNGQFEFEKMPGKAVRLVGNNLCYGANYLAKNEADQLARRFQLMGYNSIRLHHYDVDLLKGNWRAKASDDIDPAKLDQLDYMFAALKKAGMYITIDLMSSRGFAKGEIAGYDRPCRWEFKAVFPIVPGAFDAWSKFAIKLLNHVNPYTGMKWKDDPALISICPLNEDTVTSVWGNKHVKQLYLDGFAKWMKAKGKPLPERKTMTKTPDFAIYLTELKVASNRKLTAFFKENGVKALITGSNWWDTMIQAWPRSEFDFVDNHLYGDHPWGWPEQRWNQNSALKGSGNRRYTMPLFKAPTRIFGKPFTISEYNWCAPNKYRAEGGALMGAYASLQNWDAIYRFAWAHSSKTVLEQSKMLAFDIGSDPLSLLTERQILLMFGRSDVSPAKKKYVYAATLAEAAKSGPGDMWSRGLFPADFGCLGFVSQIGSQWVEGGRPITGTFDGIVARSKPAHIKAEPFIPVSELPFKNKDKAPLVSDTNEISIDHRDGVLTVVSPRTECIAALAHKDRKASCLAVRKNNTFASFSASSMDGAALASSKRILLFHLTNVLSSNMIFTDSSMKQFAKGKKWSGSLPYIVHDGSATVALKNANAGLKLYAVDFAGKRLREVPTTYADGTYTFQVQTVVPGQESAMVYELSEK